VNRTNCEACLEIDKKKRLSSKVAAIRWAPHSGGRGEYITQVKKGHNHMGGKERGKFIEVLPG